MTINERLLKDVQKMHDWALVLHMEKPTVQSLKVLKGFADLLDEYSAKAIKEKQAA